MSGYSLPIHKLERPQKQKEAEKKGNQEAENARKYMKDTEAVKKKKESQEMFAICFKKNFTMKIFDGILVYVSMCICKSAYQIINPSGR